MLCMQWVIFKYDSQTVDSLVWGKTVLNFNTCIGSCNYQLNQGTELFHHPKEFTCATYILVIKLVPYS